MNEIDGELVSPQAREGCYKESGGSVEI